MTLYESRILWQREMTNLLRRPMRFFGLFFSPLMWLFLYGYVLKTIVPSINGVDYVQWILPASIATSMFTSGSRGGMTMLRDKNSGFLKEVLVAPVPRFSIILGIASGVITRILIQSTLLLLVGGLFLGVQYGGILGFLWIWAVSSFVVILFGLGLVTFFMALAWRIDDMQTYSASTGFALLPVTLLSGAISPTSRYPAWMGFLARFNPLTFAIDALRVVILGQTAAYFPLWLDLMYLLGFALVSLSFGAGVMRLASDAN
ncbi:MAG: ABC transporter permease [Thermoplasmatota archaeon]